MLVSRAQSRQKKRVKTPAEQGARLLINVKVAHATPPRDCAGRETLIEHADLTAERVLSTSAHVSKS